MRDFRLPLTAAHGNGHIHPPAVRFALQPATDLQDVVPIEGSRGLYFASGPNFHPQQAAWWGWLGPLREIGGCRMPHGWKVSGDRNSSHPATDALSQGGLRPFGCSIWMHLDLRLMLPLGVQIKPLKTQPTGPYTAIPALHSWSQAVQTISQQVTLLLSSGCWAGSEMAHNQGIVVTTHLGGHESSSFGCRPYEQLWTLFT